MHHLNTEELSKQDSLRLNTHGTCCFRMQFFHDTLTPRDIVHVGFPAGPQQNFGSQAILGFLSAVVPVQSGARGCIGLMRRAEKANLRLELATSHPARAAPSSGSPTSPSEGVTIVTSRWARIHLSLWSTGLRHPSRLGPVLRTAFFLLQMHRHKAQEMSGDRSDPGIHAASKSLRFLPLGSFPLAFSLT